MKKKRLLLAALLMISVFSAHAETGSEYDIRYSKCLKKGGVTNNDSVAACSEEVSEKAKAEITRRYKSIYKRLSADNPEDAAKFEVSQKAWLQYRNIHCHLAGSYIGSPMYDFCPMNLNAARALELRELDGQ